MDDDAASERIGSRSIADRTKKNFESYDELKTKLNRVLGLDKPAAAATRSLADELEEEPAPRFKAREPDVDLDAEDVDLEKLFENPQD